MIVGGCVRLFSAKRTLIVKLYLSPLEHEEEDRRTTGEKIKKKLFGAKLR